MSNREWLKELASETNIWPNAMGPLGLGGVHRLETARTLYVLRDGVVVDIGRRDGEEQSHADLSLTGMRVVGWLLEVEGHRRLLDRWLPGARAVLWRAPDKEARVASKIAVTSPSFAFVMCSQAEEEDDVEDDADTTAEYVPLPPHSVESGSFTRLFPQEH